MVYYLYKIFFKNGNKRELYLKDIDKATILGYVVNKETKAYDNIIINWSEAQTIKCHELRDTVLTKFVDGTEQVMRAANEIAE